MNDAEKQLFLSIEDWFVKHLPEPPFYKDGNTIKAITWFKTETSKEMTEKLEPLMGLLEKYQVAYDVIYSNDVGQIVYEDQYQVGVI